MGVFDGSIGAFMIGTTLSVFMAGVTSTQVFTYLVSYPNDRRLWKAMIWTLLAIDLFHTACSVYTTYLWATNFGTSYLSPPRNSATIEELTITLERTGNLAILVHSPWTFSIDPALTGIVASVVHAFYAYRVYLLSGRAPWLPILISTLSLVQLGFACGATAKIFVLNSEFARFQEWTYGVLVWLVSAACADVVVTGSLIYYLRRSVGAYMKTNTVVDAILRQTIETNGVTMLVALIDAILFAASSESWHVIPNLILVKLYFNSVLVSLNSRQRHAASINASDNEPSIVKSGTSGLSTRKGKLNQRFGTAARPKSSLPLPPLPVYISMDVEVSVEPAGAGLRDAKQDDAHPFSQLPQRHPPHHPYAQSNVDLELQRVEPAQAAW